MIQKSNNYLQLDFPELFFEFDEKKIMLNVITSIEIEDNGIPKNPKDRYMRDFNFMRFIGARERDCFEEDSRKLGIKELIDN